MLTSVLRCNMDTRRFNEGKLYQIIALLSPRASISSLKVLTIGNSFSSDRWHYFLLKGTPRTVTINVVRLVCTIVGRGTKS